MENEIPAGTQVKVAVTQDGVSTVRDAEVLAHMDGVVHVNMDGDAVSIAPSQIVQAVTPAGDSGTPPVQPEEPTPAPAPAADPAPTPAPPAEEPAPPAADPAPAPAEENPNEQASTATAESGAAAAGN